MPRRPIDLPLDPDQQRQLAVDLFNYTWTFIEKDDRTDEETERMIDASHGSRLFWREVGTTVNHARSEWQLARVYATAGRAAPAIHHAQRCLALCEQDGVGDFDLACAYEALARAHAVAGDAELSRRFEALGRETAARIDDAEDRDLVLADLGALPH